MMKNLKILLVIFICVFANTIFASESNSKKGISAYIQDDQLGVVFPFFNKTNIYAIIPSLSFLWVENGGLEYSIGFTIRKYRSGIDIKPYLGIGIGTIGLKSEKEDTIFDYTFGVVFGGEYYFSDQFSVGVEAQLNISKSDEKSIRFGNPGGTNANTATAIYATIYFN